ncbi:MAG TPA: maleylacetoacetate isomerase [Rhizomicrobium sp.]
MSASDSFTLYTYFRSSAAYRVRIALNLKGIDAEYVFVHLLKDGGQQHDPAFLRVNPQALVPALVHDGHAIGQSLAIIEYLDEIRPEPPLLPKEAFARARVRQIAYAVGCDIHPVNNLRVLNYLRQDFGRSEHDVLEWTRHWIHLGFAALEKLLLAPQTGRFCHGDKPTMADVCLIPQLANARRAKMDVSVYPALLRIEEAALALPAFAKALPNNQPDAE